MSRGMRIKGRPVQRSDDNTEMDTYGASELSCKLRAIVCDTTAVWVHCNALRTVTVCFGETRVTMMSSNLRCGYREGCVHLTTNIMSSGTQSPPLEATDSHNPMGVSCIDGSCSKPMKDVQQREEYFSDAVKEHYARAHEMASQGPKAGEKK